MDINNLTLTLGRDMHGGVWVNVDINNLTLTLTWAWSDVVARRDRHGGVWVKCWSLSCAPPDEVAKIQSGYIVARFA